MKTVAIGPDCWYEAGYGNLVSFDEAIRLVDSQMVYDIPNEITVNKMRTAYGFDGLYGHISKLWLHGYGVMDASGKLYSKGEADYIWMTDAYGNPSIITVNHRYKIVTYGTKYSTKVINNLRCLVRAVEIA